MNGIYVFAGDGTRLRQRENPTPPWRASSGGAAAVASGAAAGGSGASAAPAPDLLPLELLLQQDAAPAAAADAPPAPSGGDVVSRDGCTIRRLYAAPPRPERVFPCRPGTWRLERAPARSRRTLGTFVKIAKPVECKVPGCRVLLRGSAFLSLLCAGLRPNDMDLYVFGAPSLESVKDALKGLLVFLEDDEQPPLRPGLYLIRGQDAAPAPGETPMSVDVIVVTGEVGGGARGVGGRGGPLVSEPELAEMAARARMSEDLMGDFCRDSACLFTGLVAAGLDLYCFIPDAAGGISMGLCEQPGCMAGPAVPSAQRDRSEWAMRFFRVKLDMGLTVKREEGDRMRLWANGAGDPETETKKTGAYLQYVRGKAGAADALRAFLRDDLSVLEKNWARELEILAGGWVPGQSVEGAVEEERGGAVAGQGGAGTSAAAAAAAATTGAWGDGGSEDGSGSDDDDEEQRELGEFDFEKEEEEGDEEEEDQQEAGDGEGREGAAGKKAKKQKKPEQREEEEDKDDGGGDDEDEED
jgi:hypothetical protein